MDNNHVMYTIGQIVRCVYGNEEIPHGVLNVILQKPVTGIGEMTRRGDLKGNDPELARLVNKIKFDELEVKSMSLSQQSYFWLGYNHYAALINGVRDYGAEELTQFGKLLYGEQWQTNLARELKLSDARRIRAWLSGERKIPVGVWCDIADLLTIKHHKIAEALKDIKQ